MFLLFRTHAVETWKRLADMISQRIPTSMTCFGRLLIPEYNAKEKLARKLKIALENSEGFGVV
jgi:hypothetical protein